MHVLIIPSEPYVPKEDPLEGIFQKDQAHILKKVGFKVGVISPHLRSIRLFAKGWTQQSKGYQFEYEDGIPVWTYRGWNWIPYIQRWKRWLWLRAGMVLMERYLSEQGRPEVVHAHNAQRAGVLAFAIKRTWNIPYVLTEHSSAYAGKHVQASEIPYIQEAFRNAESRLVVSPQLGHLLEGTIGDAIRPWQWVPNVLGELFEEGPWMTPGRTVGKRSFVFLNVGTLIEVKGQDQLLFAFAEQFREKTDVRLRIGGDGPLRGRLEALARKLGIVDQMTLLGELSREEILAEMQGCDAYVHSSHYETFGVTLIEALSCGKPVVSTACGGPECIVNKENGVLVPQNDRLSLGKAMDWVRVNLESYRPVTIREDCISRFGQRAFVNRLSNIYQECVTKGVGTKMAKGLLRPPERTAA